MPRFNTRFLALLACALLSSADNLAAAEPFRVCSDPLNPPFSDKNGNGFENKIAELFAQDLGMSIEYTWFPQRIGFIRNTLKAKLPDRDAYKCDVVIGVPVGYDMTVTTKPYYRSTYVLLYAKNRGWDDIKSINDLTMLAPDKRKTLRIAMFDRGPGTAWLHQNGLIAQGIPYQSMSGDPDNNTAMTIENDIKAGVIDMVIIWGPMAGHLVSDSPPGTYEVLPMPPTPGIRFDYSIAMGVRYGDQERKKELNRLIEKHSEQIKEILLGYHVPLLEPIAPSGSTSR